MYGKLFLPAVGYRHDLTDGALSSPTTRGLYWSSTQRASSSGHRLAFDSALSDPDVGATISKSHAMSIRCVR